jgi:hypothetical protein
MKSEHRHQLETNWLAKRLNVVIERFGPYASTVAGIVVAIVLVMLVWLYVAGSSSARHSEAWDEFNQAILEPRPNVERLRVVAEEHSGTEMQLLADVTWADSQVWLAARNYLYDRTGAMQALEKATSRYESVLGTSNDERLLNRARLGLARIHELRGELDKARAEYLKVGGGYEQYAKAQAERLATPESKETYAWLAKAQPPRPTSAFGAGAPLKTPEFSAGDLDLPGETPESGMPAGTAGDGESFEKLLEGLKLDFDAIDETTDRYQPGAAPQAQPQTPRTQPESTPAQPESTPSESDSTSAQGDRPTAQAPVAPDTSSESESDNANAGADQPEQ